MMDPFTISVSILTVLAAVDRLVVILPTFQQYFRAREEIETLQTELLHLRIIMVAAMEMPDTSKDPGIEAVLGDCLLVLQSIENEMAPFREMASAVGTSKKPNSHGVRLKWTMAKPRISQSRQQLRDYMASLTVALLVRNSTIGASLSLEHAARLEVDIIQDPTGAQTVGERMSLHPRDDSIPRCNLQTESLTTINEGAVVNETRQTLVAESSKPNVKIKSSDDQHPNSIYAEEEYVQEYCDVGCPSDHRRSVTKTFDILGGFLGKVWLTTKSKTVTNRPGTEASCRGSSPLMYHIVWYSPRWLCKRGICLSFNNGGRIHASLSFPRILPPDHQLFIEIRKGNITVVKNILSTGKASVADLVAPYGYTAFDLALLYRHIDIGQLLLDMGSQRVTSPGCSVSDILNFFKSWSVINSTMDAGTVIGDVVRIYDRSRDRDCKMIPIEIQPIVASFSELHKSVLGLSSQDVKKTARMLRANVDAKDVSGRTALHWAAKTGNHTAVQNLLQYGADPDLRDLQGMTALHLSASLDFPFCAQHLIQAGADIEAGNRFGATPLHVAATSGSLGVISQLADAGADVNATNSLGETPAIHANWAGGKQHSLELLVQKGAVLDQPDAWGYTELSDAVHTNSHQTIPYLLKTTRCSNCKLADGQTILHVAARNSNLATIELLLQGSYLLNIDPNAVDRAGYTALEYLRQRKDSGKLLEPFCSLLLHVKSKSTNC